MKLLQIDSCLGVGSTGRITESIAQIAQRRDWDCSIVHGARYVKRPSCMKDYQSVSVLGEYFHYAEGLLFDNHGLSSCKATQKVIDFIKKEAPDIIHLHCIHGYYLNYKILFEFLQTIDTPIVWTFHDCWAFTGHCAYFDSINCEKWKTGCHHCDLKNTYPSSWILDKSERNYNLKKELFTAIANQTVIVPVSNWLENLVKQSFFKGVRVKTIHNGIDIGLFKPQIDSKLGEKLGINNKTVVLGVALPWSPRKGLTDMIKISEILPKKKYQVILIGLDDKQIDNLPKNVLGIKKTNNAHELAEYYSLASYFINPTYEDNFPTTNIEALACGTPVITYQTGGSPEAITKETGWVVDRGDVKRIAEIILHNEELSSNEHEHQRLLCRNRAEKEFNRDNKFLDYLNLYNELVHSSL